MTTDVDDGRIIAGRYLLDEDADQEPGLPGVPGEDLILGRFVRALVLDPDDPATGTLLDAARRAALVHDQRLVPVLDVDRDDSDAWVVTDEVRGSGLDELCLEGPLTVEDARAVIGEAASAIEAANRLGVHHLGLTPAHVRVTRDGEVLVVGIGVHAGLRGEALDDVDVLAAARRDATDLVRLLHLALTGVPAPADGALPAVPYPEDVPAELRALCERTLVDDEPPVGPASVIRALAPWRDVAPASPEAGKARRAGRTLSSARLAGVLGRRHAGERAAEAEAPARGASQAAPQGSPPPPPQSPAGAGRSSEVAPGAAPAAPEPVAVPEPRTTAESAATGARSRTNPAIPTGPVDPPARPASGVPASGMPASGMPASTDSASTVPAAAEGAAAATGAAAAAAAGAAGAPASPHEPVAMAAGSAPPVPATAPSTVPVTGAEPVAASEPDPHGDPLDAFRGDADERAAGTPEGGWKLPLVLLGVGLLVALLLLTLALTGVIGRGNETAEPAPAPSATAQATEAAPAEDPAPEPTPTAPPAVDDVTLVDPGQRYPDHPEHLDLATDGNENTAWRTLWYESPTYAGVKDGAGLVVALDEEAVLTAVGLDVRGEGGHAQLLTAPPGEAGSTVLAEGDIGPGSEIMLPEPAVLDEVVVWFDVLPRATENGRNMVALHELTVR